MKVRFVVLTGFFVLLVMHFLAPSNSFAFRYRNYDITLSGQLSQIYDSNINFDKDDEIDGYRTDASVNLGLNRAWRRATLSLKGLYQHGIYNDNADIGTGRETLALNFGYELSAYTHLRLMDSFSHYKEPFEFDEEFGRVKGRYDTYVNNFTVALTREINKDFSVAASYNNTIVRRDEGSDVNGHSAGITLNYNLSVDKIFHFGYSYAFSRIRGEETESTGHYVVFGMDKYFTQRLILVGQIALGRSGSDGAGNDTSSSISLSLKHELDRNTHAALSFVLHNASIINGDSDSDNWRISGDLRRELSDKINGSVNVFYGEGTFRDISGKDQLFGFVSTVDYEITERMKANLRYVLSRLWSTDETREYIRHLIGLGVSYVF